MKTPSRLFLTSLLNFIFLFLSAQKTNFTQYVNPFVGTGGHGHAYPGAQLPFGFMQLSPDTRLDGWDGCSAYHYSDSIIYGFSHTHLSGTGCSDYGDILIMPSVGIKTPGNYNFASNFSKKTEKASPGYYSVLLEKPNVLVELTATERCGMHKYTFPKKTEKLVFLDLKHRDEVLDSYIEIVSNTEIRGMRRSKAWANDQHIYFVIRFSKPFTKAEIFKDDIICSSSIFARSKNVKSRFIFSSKLREPLYLKIGISGVDTLGARLNLDKEMPNWDFEKIEQQANEKWNKELSKIEVEGGTDEQMRVFYSALYHAFLSPNVFNDVDGRYRGRDNEIYIAKGWNYYTVFSLWDTYRTLHPLLTLIDPARTLDFIKTFLAQYEQSGLLPMWELSANETDCMIGYHAVPVIFDAWSKGIKDFDINKAYEAMKASAMQKRLGISEMDILGYIPSDLEHESVSKTLEYAFDDWCIAQVAKSLGNDVDYQYFINRAQAYKQVFDKNSGFMRPRFNGGWMSPFDPTEVNNNYTEANSWQYSFYVPHDIGTFIQLMGGNKDFEAKLDALFEAKESLSGRGQVDITGLIGQYAHGNEPSHHIAYLYNFVGAPEKTQFYVRKIMNDFYTSKPDGLCGNEDCGQMSAWLVMSAMGFYPVTPGVNYYCIGSPWFKKVKINLPSGKVFTIDAPNNSESNIYIKSAKVNGVVNLSSFLLFEDIEKGSTLYLEMTDKKGSNFGKQIEHIPTTKILGELFWVSPIINAASRTFVDSILVDITNPNQDGKSLIYYSTNDSNKLEMIEEKSAFPKSNIYYTIDGTIPNRESKIATKVFYIHSTTEIKSIIIADNGKQSLITEAKFYLLPKNVSVKLTYPFNPQYNAGGAEGLVDGIRGTTNWRLGNWQGYQEADFEVVIDYGSDKMIKTIGAGFLQDAKSWIWMPTEVEYYTSKDGKTFDFAGKINNEIAQDDFEIQTLDFQFNLEKQTSARFIKVKAKNIGNISNWHPGFGFRGFIFVDEVWILSK